MQSEQIKLLIAGSLGPVVSYYGVSIPEGLQYVVELPRGDQHGDWATNVAFQLSRYVKRKPLEVAEKVRDSINERLAADPTFTLAIKKIEVEGPGFINFFLAEISVALLLLKIKDEDSRYGATDFGKGKKVLLEYVSANPTGPLTIAHGRQACLGDALARILKITGFTVHREYYLNDTGRQIETLGRSAWLRYLELLGVTIAFPEEGYQGAYIKDLAREVLEKEGERFKNAPEKEAIAFFSVYAADEIMKGIRRDLEDLRVTFDNYFSEKKLRESGAIEKTIDILRAKGLVFESEGALWFKSTEFKDDKDRVLRKSTGDYTYLAPDIAYHQQKFTRGFEMLVNLWGPDHHGYVPRMKAAVQALGGSEEALKVLLVQLTTLFRKGVPVRMSTRAGEFVTLRELMDEVGADATRVFFLLRRVESLLDFDLDLAKEKTQENPVYYLQYAHARICSIVEYGGVKVDKDVRLDLLKEKEEFDLIKELAHYPATLQAAASGLEPYRVLDFLREVATRFHKFYTLHRVVTDDRELTKARLLLVDCVRIVLRNGLELIGVSQPAKM